jgi:two-component system, chemotaxis family, sensor kinase CheA
MSANDPIAAFRTEAADLLEQIEQGLLDLGQTLDDRALVDTVFRGLHTLKGSGAMFGFDALADFTHHCESAFDKVRKGRAVATHDLITIILSAKDHMQALLDDATTASQAKGDTILEALRQAVIASEIQGADAGSEGATGAAAASNASASAVTPSGASAGWTLRFRLPPDCLVNGTNPMALLAELRELGATAVRAQRDRLPPLAEFVPTECQLGWEVELPGDVTRDMIEDVFIFVMDDMELTLEQHACEVQTSAAVAPPPPAAAQSTTEAETSSGKPSAPNMLKRDESVRVPAERLDELMNRVGELVIAQSRLAQLAQQGGGVDEIVLREISEDIERLSSELRDTTMVLRMMPVGNLFSRFRRLVHDLSGETGKSIEFVTEGEATEVDKTVIERIADPLVHLIRNSCDHGLETPEARHAAGKSPGGQIKVSAHQTGSEVVITVADDGRGINREAVRAKAEAQGLITPDSVVEDHDLLQMIFHPGFSTAAQVTNLSGRGVGMDVVKKTVESLRGTIRMESVQGAGTQIMLHLPLTLAIIECMLVRVGTGRYAIPLSAVEECLQLPTREAESKSGRSFLDVRSELVPFLRMNEMFQSDRPTDLHQKVVIVRSGAQRVGLVVDQIIGNAQTVIKPLSRFHTSAQSFAGATILGDGTVALILDVVQLLSTASLPPRPATDWALGEAA